MLKIISIFYNITQMNSIYDSICKNATYLNREDRLEILKIVGRYDKDAIKRFSDGSRIILNKLPEQTVKDIYNFIQRRLKLI